MLALQRGRLTWSQQAESMFAWIRTHLVELLLIASCWLPYYLIPRPLPDANQNPFDNIWIAQFTHEIANGFNPFVQWDPYLRYIPQAAVTWFIELFLDLSVQDVIFLNAQYTILLEGLAAPVVLYVLTRSLFSRRAALGSLLATAIFQFPFAPWYPTLAFPTWLLTLLFGSPNVCTECDIMLLGDNFYFSPQWQYAFSLPWILGAFYFSTRKARDRLRYAPVLAGICLGVVSGIQLAQAVFTATIVAVTLIWLREWKPLLISAGVSMLIATPNLLVMYYNPSVWVSRGSELARLDKIVAIVNTPTGIGLALAALVGVGILFALGPRAAETVSDRVPVVNHLQERPLLVFWPTILFGVAMFTAVIGSGWFMRHALYLFSYGAFVWTGVGVAGVSQRLALSNRFEKA